MTPLGWYACYDYEDGVFTPRDLYRWRPNLQLDGLCLQLDIWFGSERECLDFIRDQILNRVML